MRIPLYLQSEQLNSDMNQNPIELFHSLPFLSDGGISIAPISQFSHALQPNRTSLLVVLQKSESMEPTGIAYPPRVGSIIRAKLNNRHPQTRYNPNTTKIRNRPNDVTTPGSRTCRCRYPPRNTATTTKMHAATPTTHLRCDRCTRLAEKERAAE